MHDDKNYWQINKKPKNERLELNSYSPLYIFVSTIKKLKNTSQKAQQSDYEHTWNKNLNNIDVLINQKSIFSIKWKKIKDNVKLFFRDSFLFKDFFF